jgi:A/G-specific adenine glycosylase
VENHGGRVPADPEALAGVPGVGRYTLGAVLSQAFDLRLPILEANSERVLCRLFGHRGDPRRGALRRLLWAQAEALLPAKGCGEFNQALMELGALVCTPAAPRCGACPLRERCEAYRLGLQAEIPLKAPAPAPVDVAEAAVVARRGEEVFLVRRPDAGRWAGLWEFPHGPLEEGETPGRAARRLLRTLTGLRAEPGEELLTVRHGVTRFRITLVCLEAAYRSGTFRSAFYTEGLWLRPEGLHAYPVSAPQRRLAQALVADRQPRLFT